MSRSDAQNATGEQTRFQPEDILRQAQIQHLAVAPDGAAVVYSRRVIEDGKYRTNLWLVPWSGGEPRQLTREMANDTQPVYSPDGRSIAFISDRGGREQPWILPLDGGEPRLAADIAGKAKSVRWSPDGTRLLIVAPSGVERLSVGDPEDPTARVIDDLAWRLDAFGLRNQYASAWVVSLDGAESDAGNARGVGGARRPLDARRAAHRGRRRRGARGRHAPTQRACGGMAARGGCADGARDACRTAGRHRSGAAVSGWDSPCRHRQGFPAATLLGRQSSLRSR